MTLGGTLAEPFELVAFAHQQVHFRIDRSCPGIRRQTGYNVEVKRDARTTVKGGGDTTDDDKINVMVVKPAQNVEKVARHWIVVD